MAEIGPARIFTLEDLEKELGEHRFPAFVKACEDDFAARVQNAIQHAIDDKNISFVFISGPTSSGKTTMATHITEAITARGRRAHLSSLDDYYYEGGLLYDDMGRPDMESVGTLELSLLHEHLSELAKGKEIRQPLFDFSQRKRVYPEGRVLKLEKGDVMIVEGLHGLSDEVIGDLDHDRYLSIFIRPNAQFINDGRTLSCDDVRKLRRISRDVIHRGTQALATLDYWPMIEKNEEEFVPVYSKRADHYIDTSLAYEFCVTAPMAQKQLEKSISLYLKGQLPPSNNVKPGLFYADLNRAIKEARRLDRACHLIPEVDPSIVPERSILKEFV